MPHPRATSPLTLACVTHSLTNARQDWYAWNRLRPQKLIVELFFQ